MLQTTSAARERFLLLKSLCDLYLNHSLPAAGLALSLLIRDRNYIFKFPFTTEHNAIPQMRMVDLREARLEFCLHLALILPIVFFFPSTQVFLLQTWTWCLYNQLQAIQPYAA
jgi:hypothetical protein